MEGRVYTKLTQGIDSFLRVTNTLRRKEFNIKALNMTIGDDYSVNLDIFIDDSKNRINEAVNYISKLVDAKEVKII